MVNGKTKNKAIEQSSIRKGSPMKGVGSIKGWGLELRNPKSSRIELNLPFLKYRHKIKQRSGGTAATYEDNAFLDLT